jgi:hypothetical protein
VMTRQPPFTANLVAVRRNQWVLGLAASPFAGMLVCIVAGLLPDPQEAPLGHGALLFACTVYTLALGVAALLVVWRKNYWPTTVPVEVQADALGVSVGDRFVPRAQIRTGFVLPGAAAARVLLQRRWGLPIELHAGSTEEARGLLRALGLDTSKAVAEFRTSSRITAMWSLMATLGCWLGPTVIEAARATMHAYPLLFFGLQILLTGLLSAVPVIAHTRLSVGADGIALRWMWTRRFLGYNQIRDVTRYDEGGGSSRVVGVKIWLRSGEEMLLRVGGNDDWSSDQTALLHERIREAMDAYRPGAPVAEAVMLRRGEREVHDWVAALRSIDAGANAGLRTPPLPRERLFRILEDPAAAAPERAAAAAALGVELDEEGHARLRAAAEDAEMEAALAELEKEGSEARAS